MIQFSVFGMLTIFTFNKITFENYNSFLDISFCLGDKFGFFQVLLWISLGNSLKDLNFAMLKYPKLCNTCGKSSLIQT